MVAVRIEIASTLTQEDENRLAAGVLKALSGLWTCCQSPTWSGSRQPTSMCCSTSARIFPGFDSVPSIATDAPQPRLES